MIDVLPMNRDHHIGGTYERATKRENNGQWGKLRTKKINGRKENDMDGIGRQ